MKKNGLKTYDNLSFLYELKSSTNRRFSTIENCASFLALLLQRDDLLYGSIWIKNTFLPRVENDQSYTLRYAFPQQFTNKTTLSSRSFLAMEIRNDLFKIVRGSDENFENYVQEKNINGGTFVIYKLQDIGFIKLYSESNSIFCNKELLQLNDAVGKFGLQLENALLHESLQIEQAAKASIQESAKAIKKKHELLMQNLSEGLIITDLEGTITYVNKQMTRLTGFSKEELIGENAIKLMASPCSKELLHEKLNLQAKGISEEFVILHKRKNGNDWLGRIKASPYKNTEGKIIGSIGTVADITHQQKAREAIRLSEKKYRSLFHKMHDALFFIDADFRIAESNKFGKTLLGFEPDEKINLSIREIIHPDDLPDTKNYFEKLLENGFYTDYECRIFTKQGELKYIQVNSTGIFEDGKFIGSQDIIRDITAQKKAEQALILAKQTADAARLAERQFLANMSHEIRTPMNTVIGMTHLLYETRPSDSQKEIIDSLLFSADSLMRIIDNILDLSKIEAGELAFEEHNFDLGELMNSLHKTFQLKAQGTPVKLEMEMDEKIQNLLTGDPVRLSQILTNLLGNAMKFTKKGTIGLYVKVLHANAENYIIQYHVHDTGIGIAPDKLDAVFDIFKQADVRITRKYGGTGLGLSIVKQLTELQGGAIRVESTKGKGSDFFVTLPFRNSGISRMEKMPDNQVQPGFESRLETIRVLIVEDNPMNQKLMDKILEHWGCAYTFASSGEEAIYLTKHHLFDIILMDIHMPEMDGCDTTKLIRQNKQNPNHDVPIVALTAAALLEERKRAMQVGMNDFLTKPCSPAQLRQTVLKHTSNLNMEKENKDSVLALEKIYDLSYLREMANGDQEFIKDMLEIFLAEIPKGLDQIRAGIADSDFKYICGTAHRIKSNYMMMGMKAEQQTALKIEQMIKTNRQDIGEIKLLYQKLEEGSRQVYKPLRVLLEKETEAIL